MEPTPTTQPPPEATESDPLLLPAPATSLQEQERERRENKKPFYRPRPLWLVPFAIIASITRGMTLAPRVEVFTQLSCNAIHSHYNHTSGDSTSLLSVFMPSSSLSLDPSSPSSLPPSSPPSFNSLSILFPSSSSSSPFPLSDDDDPNDEDPRNLPSQICLSDPAVQAGAARLQTIMTTTMGTLSALTTGWWGRLGERVGRTRVLSAAVGGMFLTDLTFILVSTPSSPLSHHGHILLLLSPFIEGLLGGWSTLQATASAYVSDCTSDGSRAHIFSRFIGVFYLGFSLGPMVGAYFIRNPLPIFSAISPSSPSHSSSGPGFNLIESFASRAIPGRSGVPNVTSVFWVAIICSFVNLVFAMGLLPESLDKVKRRAAMKAREAEEAERGAEEEAAALREELDQDQDIMEEEGRSGAAKSVSKSRSKGRSVDALMRRTGAGGRATLKRLFGPLAVFAPRKVYRTSDENGRVGGARTDWSLTLLAGSLAFYLLSSGIFQIKYLYAEHQFGWSAEQLSYYISFVGGARAICLLFVLPTIISYFKPKPVPSTAVASASASAKAAEEALHHSITFDLTLGRLSLMLDILSHTLVSLPISDSSLRFAGLTVISSFASGMHPAAQSLAVCIMQRQALRGVGEEGDDEGREGGNGQKKKKVEGMGPLFGGVAALQAMGQMILGPLIFGVLYSSTVATLPKAIFMLAGALATVSLVILFLIHAEPKSHYTSSSASSSNAQPSAPVTQRPKPTSFFTSFASLFSSQPSSSSSHRRSTNPNRPRSSLVAPSSSNYGTISSHGKANGTGTGGKSKGKKKARFGVDNEEGEPERGRSRVVKRVGDAAGASGSGSWDGYASASAYGEGVSVDVVPASVSVNEGNSWVDKSARV